MNQPIWLQLSTGEVYSEYEIEKETLKAAKNTYNGLRSSGVRDGWVALNLGTSPLPVDCAERGAVPQARLNSHNRQKRHRQEDNQLIRP